MMLSPPLFLPLFYVLTCFVLFGERVAPGPNATKLLWLVARSFIAS